MPWSEERIREEMRRLDRITGLAGAELPIFFGNGRSTLGLYCSTGYFRFSRYYFDNPDWPEECALDVIRHEYAHYMDEQIYGAGRDRSHGSTWKMCCLKVGADPTRLYDPRSEDYHRARRTQREALQERCSRLKPGMALHHPVHGSGVIEEIEGEGTNLRARVAFSEAGTKRLGLSWILEHCQVDGEEEDEA